MKEIGLITKWKVEEFSHGLIIGDMMGNISMIKRKDLEFSTGQMVVNTKESGKMGSSMVKVNILQHQVKLKEVSGPKERELLGSEYY